MRFARLVGSWPAFAAVAITALAPLVAFAAAPVAAVAAAPMTPEGGTPGAVAPAPTTTPTTLAPMGAGLADLAALAERARPAVVHLRLLDRFGEEMGTASGFLIRADGVLVTNHHVVNGAEAIVATLADGATKNAVGLLADDEKDDLALVRLEPGTYRSLELASTGSVREGMPVFVLGSPLGLANTLSQGIVSALRPDGLPPEQMQGAGARASLVQHSAPIAPGSSGSPLIGFDGKVVGVVQSGFTGMGDLNFAVSVDALHALLGATDLAAAPAKLGAPLLRNLIISLSVFGAIALLLIVHRIWRGRRKPVISYRM